MHPRVVAALHRLQRERRTGIFRTNAKRVRREVSLESGAIVGAHSSSIDERLGEIMVRRGGITRQQLHDASLLIRTGRRLGDALVELRIVARDDVEGFVRTQLAEITSKIVNDPPNKLEFKDATQVSKVTERPVAVADAILEAARTAFENDELVTALLDETMVPELTPESFAVLETLCLDSQEAFVLSRCDGQSDVHSILAQSPLTEGHTARIVLGLQQAGIVEFRSPRVSEHSVDASGALE